MEGLQARLIMEKPERFGAPLTRKPSPQHPSTSPLLHLPPSTHPSFPSPLHSFSLPLPPLHFSNLLMHSHLHSSTHTHPDTSRSPRSHEINGQNFHFVSWQKMERDIQNNQFVEHGYLEGDYYGTSINSIRDVINSGKTCLLVLFPSVSIINK